jgi:hypothetical protein
MDVSIPRDTVETSAEIPAQTVEVTTLDPREVPLPRVLVELLAHTGSAAATNTAPVQRAVSDARGRLTFTNVPVGRDGTYRLVTVVDGIRSSSRPFAIEEHTGTKAKLHVYPVTKELDKALVVARSFWFLEPRDDVVYLELMTEFLNLGSSTWVPEGVELPLPDGFTSFTTTESDPDIFVRQTARGVSFVGAMGPGQHAVTFSLQIPSDNRSEVELRLPLVGHTAEVRVATAARPGVTLSVEGYPEAEVTQTKGQAPLLMTNRAFSRDGSAPPDDLRLTLGGLPVVGPGRLVAVALSLLLALGSLVVCWVKDRRGGSSTKTGAGEREAKERLLDELVELSRAHQHGLLSDETFGETQGALVTATVRLERQLTNDRK